MWCKDIAFESTSRYNAVHQEHLEYHSNDLFPKQQYKAENWNETYLNKYRENKLNKKPKANTKPIHPQILNLMVASMVNIK